MKYNRALDYTALALVELKAGNGSLAARLMAKAVEQSDITAAIATLEFSNKQAFSLQASAKKVDASPKKRLKANDEFPFTDDATEQEAATMEECAVEDESFGESDDPLMDVEDGTDEEPAAEAPGETMAKVLSGMVRKATKK
jgi:hypothetical protein